MKLLFTLVLTLLITSGGLANGQNGLKFYPVAPCRIVDTRIPSPTQCDVYGCPGISNGKTAFWAAGDGTRIGYKNRPFVPILHKFEYQGGEPDGCGIPRDAKAVHVDVFAVPIPHPAWPTGNGHFRIWPYEVINPDIWGLSPPPHAAAILWSNNNMVSNAITIPICDPDILEDCEFDFVITSRGTVAHFIADVYGYYKN